MSMNRRTFINRPLALAAAGATWFDAPRLLPEITPPARRNRYGGYPMGILSFSLECEENPNNPITAEAAARVA